MADRLPEDQNWIATTGLSRRAALTGSAIAAGFALACQPVAATTIHTDDSGIDEGDVTIPTGGFSMPGYRARPKGVKAPPVILVVHEVFGVHGWIRDICRRLAKAGYYAIAPDLFARAGDATKVADIPTLVKTIVSKTPDAQVMSDLDRTVAFAAGEGGNVAHLGITGFCWGGRTTWLYAAHSKALKAGVAYYGRLNSEKSAGQLHHPIDLAPSLHVPVLGLYGGMDKGIPQTDVEAMRAAIKAAHKPSQIIVYPQADHGFMADYRPSYDAQAAQQAWAAMLDWFKHHL